MKITAYNLKLIFKQIINERWPLTIIVMIVLVWLGISSHVYDSITPESFLGAWFKRVYSVLDLNYYLAIPICFTLIFLGCKLSKWMWSKEEKKYSPFVIIVLVWLFLLHQPLFEYSRIIWDYDYREFILTLLGLIAVVDLGDILLRMVGLGGIQKIASTCQKYGDLMFAIHQVRFNERERMQLLLEREKAYNARKELSKKSKDRQMMDYYLARGDDKRKTGGFTMENNTEIDFPDSLKQYAKEIVERLFQTDIEGEAFAIGITSEWGAGKTTFLRLMEETIGDGADIVEFNPWMCRNPEQVTNDFFNSLRHQLAARHPSLSRPIMQYAKYLSAITLPATKQVSIEFSGLASGGSLFERKKKLSVLFSKLEKPVVVIIDDIDRLEQDEVFEVLRLIRNTADLSNVIYLVAYDKGYVTTMLKNKINDSSTYLEKIFQLEIRLPFVTKSSIKETIISESNRQLPNSIYINQIDFNKDDWDLILTLLKTYRQAKHFARLFTLNYHCLIGRECEIQLDWKEVFWLSLLQFSDWETYEVLSKTPDVLLDSSSNIKTYPQSVSGKKLNDNTENIISRLFGRNCCNKIQQDDYFEKFFTFQIQFSGTDIEKVINANDAKDVDVIIKTWIENEKDLDYIYDRFFVYDTSVLNESQLEKYLIAILNICNYHHCDYGLSDKLVFLSRQMEYDKIFQIIDDFYERAIPTSYESSLMFMIGHLEVVINENQKHILIDKFIDNYFKKNPNRSVLDWLNYGFTYHSGFGLDEKDKLYYLNKLLEGFSKKENKPAIEEFERMYNQVDVTFMERRCGTDNWPKMLEKIRNQCLAKPE